MHICREVNLASSWMYIAYILYWFVLCHPFVDFCFWQKGGEHFVFTLTPLLMIDKKGEKYWRNFSVYMHVLEKGFMFMHSNKKNLMCFMLVYACFPCFIHKGGEEEEFLFMHIVLFCKKEKRIWWVLYLIGMFYLLIFAYMFV